MKKNVLKIMCAVLALAMFAGVMPQTSVSAAAKLSAPKNVKVACVAGKLQISWSKVKGAKSYQIYRSVDGGKYKKIDKSTSYMYVDETSFKNGAKVSYYVKASKKSSGKEVLSEASKTVTKKYSNKNTYGKVIKKLGKFFEENGIDNGDTYAIGSMPDLASIVGVAVDKSYDNLAFSYHLYDTETGDTVSIILSYEPKTDPCYVYTYTNSEDETEAIIMDFAKLSKMTKDTQRKKSDFFMYEVSEGSEADHVKLFNKAMKTVNEYANSFFKDVDGVKISDIGFKNYK